MERPSRYDMVALMVPAGADPVATPPAKHKWCSEARSHMTEGAGTLTCASGASTSLRSLRATAQPQALLDWTCVPKTIHWWIDSVVYAMLALTKGSNVQAS